MSKKNTENLPKKPEELREWNSEKEVCSFLNVGRSFFLSHFRDKITAHQWSTHLVRYHKDDVLKLSAQIREGGIV